MRWIIAFAALALAQSLAACTTNGGSDCAVVSCADARGAKASPASSSGVNRERTTFVRISAFFFIFCLPGNCLRTKAHGGAVLLTLD